MKHPPVPLRLARAVSCLAVVFTLTAGAAWAGSTVTDVSLSSYYNGSWQADGVNGSIIASAPTSGNTGTGITFADWNGNLVEVTQGVTQAITIGSVALTANSTVNTLMNTFYGDNDLDAIVTFTNSIGATESYDITGGDSIRDYNQNIYQNNLNGGDPGVTPQEWWNDGGDGQRLDVQSFALPSGWDGTDLVSMTLTDTSTSGNGTDDILSALQVVTTPDAAPPPVGATPEPSSLLLLGTGALGLAGTLRRRFVRS